jgi:hypothetical protein
VTSRRRDVAMPNRLCVPTRPPAHGAGWSGGAVGRAARMSGHPLHDKREQSPCGTRSSATRTPARGWSFAGRLGCSPESPGLRISARPACARPRRRGDAEPRARGERRRSAGSRRGSPAPARRGRRRRARARRAGGRARRSGRVSVRGTARWRALGTRRPLRHSSTEGKLVQVRRGVRDVQRRAFATRWNTPGTGSAVEFRGRLEPAG